MEGQRLSERGSTVDPERSVATTIEPDLSKLLHHVDELLNIVRRIAANEGPD